MKKKCLYLKRNVSLTYWFEDTNKNLVINYKYITNCINY